MGYFKVSKLGALLDSFKGAKTTEHLNKAVSIGLQWQRLVNDRFYDVTMGSLLEKKEAEAMTLLRSRNRQKQISDERLNGRLEILDEIREEIEQKIRTGQEAQIVLGKQKEEGSKNARRAS